MPADAKEPNRVICLVGPESDTAYAAPKALLERYFTDWKGRNRAYYADATTRRPEFRDLDRSFTAVREDPAVIRDVMRIAQFREWDLVRARGSPTFRREAWMAGRLLDIDVAGHRPTERDHQDLELRQTAAKRTLDAARDAATQAAALATLDRSSPLRLKAVEMVVRALIPNPQAQEHLLAQARERLARGHERTSPTSPHPAQSKTRDATR